MSEGVKLVKDGNILTVTIDRPKANAIDLATSRALNQAFLSFRDDKSLRVAIVTGAGDRFFSPPPGSSPTRTGDRADSADSTIRAISTSRSSRPSTASPAAVDSRWCWAPTSS
jgi:1,4-dihydroxy-2-naphthoyl-CoA synthase